MNKGGRGRGGGRRRLKKALKPSQRAVLIADLNPEHNRLVKHIYTKRETKQSDGHTEKKTDTHRHTYTNTETHRYT